MTNQRAPRCVHLSRPRPKTTLRADKTLTYDELQTLAAKSEAAILREPHPVVRHLALHMSREARGLPLPVWDAAGPQFQITATKPERSAAA